MSTTIGSVTDSSSVTSSSTTTSSTDSLVGTDTFLQLMITKLSNQDPLNPTDDTEFLAQLAQFTSLERMVSMEDTVSTMSDNLTPLSAFSLVGKYVIAESDDSYITGRIDSVIYDSGEVTFDVGGTLVSMSDIKEVLAEEYSGGSTDSTDTTDTDN